MSNLVIVAIPAEDDIVWKVSSEKVPHLTLMYLGEATEDNNVQRMADFIEHALNICEHGPFWLDVDYRDTLGPDEADVLFFSNGWDAKWIKSLRGQLLQQNDIRKAFEANDQYPEWMPHLTLGYPKAPAKPLPEEYSSKIHTVHFDKIAVWTGDYDGPEFRLKWPDREDDSPGLLAYSGLGEKAVSDILEHHGIKGMKWGRHKKEDVGGIKLHYANRVLNNVERQRKAIARLRAGKGSAGDKLLMGGSSESNLAKQETRINELEKHAKRIASGKATTGDKAKFYATQYVIPIDVAGAGVNKLRDGSNTESVTVNGKTKKVTAKKAEKLDAKWEQNQYTLPKAIERHNAMADYTNSRLGTLNDKYKDHDFTHEWDKDPKDWSDTMKTYMKDYTQLENDGYRHAVNQELPSPTGKKKTELEVHGDLVRVVIKDAVAKHVAIENGDEVFLFRITKDAKGLIVKAEPVEDSMAQSEEFINDFLAHHGIKGMHWGIRSRRATPLPVNPTATSKVPHGTKRKTKIEVDGGENHPAHEDAVKVALAQAKLKKSGPSALSNQELREVANRVQLENQVALLTSHKGKQFVAKQLQTEGKNIARAGIREGAKAGVKKAVKAAPAVALAV